MKKFSKILSVALLVALVLSLGVANAFAAAPTTGSIVVNPNNDKQTYTLYRLFDADITFNEVAGENEGDPTTYTQRAITYTLPTGKTLDTTGSQWFEVNSNGFVEAKAALTDTVMKSAEFITWAKGFGTQVGSALTAQSDNDANIKWEGIPFGYYFVDSTMGSFISVDSNNPDVTIRDKNNPPPIDKEITGVNGDTSSLGVGDDTNDPGQGANEKAIAQIGDPISYKLTIVAKPGAQNYVVTDTLSDGLTPPAASNVTVSIDATNYTVDVTGQVIKVTFKQTYLDTITADTTITIEYTATLNDKAVVGAEGNPNTVKLTWGHDNENNYTTDDAKVYTAQIEVLKQDNSTPPKPLKGAGFVVAKEVADTSASDPDAKKTVYYKLDNGVVTWVDDIDSADEHKSGDDGKVAAFVGLKNGSYTLVEKTVPDGYNKLADTAFQIADKDYTNLNLKQSQTVINNAGTELPSTGGIGTTIFYVVGGVLVLAAIILLVTKKRMSE